MNDVVDRILTTYQLVPLMLRELQILDGKLRDTSKA
jgi:hypothetical protein